MAKQQNWKPKLLLPNSQRAEQRAVPSNSPELRPGLITTPPCKTLVGKNHNWHFPHLKHPQVQTEFKVRSAPSYLREQGETKTWAGVRKQVHSQFLSINSAQQTTCFTAPFRVTHISSSGVLGFLLRQTALPSHPAIRQNSVQSAQAISQAEIQPWVHKKMYLHFALCSR